MFTGLVEETGIIRSIRRKRGSIIFQISGRKTLVGLGVNDSIAVEGVCLTVTNRKKTSLEVQAVEETLGKTTLGKLEEGRRVNLERPLTPTARLGGHFVLGHVDGLGKISSVETRRSSWMFWIRVPEKFKHHLIPMGSIAVNGVSLTMAAVHGREFGVSIIPHTMRVTTFRSLNIGDAVNLEFDVLGKFVETFLRVRRG